MQGWQIFWFIFLLVSLVIFAIVAVVTTIGGASDIRSLFKTIDQHHAKGDDAGGDD